MNSEDAMTQSHGEENWGCCWADPRQCKEEATHRHKMYGEVCPRHAVEVILLHPKDRVTRLDL